VVATAPVSAMTATFFFVELNIGLVCLLVRFDHRDVGFATRLATG